MEKLCRPKLSESVEYLGQAKIGSSGSFRRGSQIKTSASISQKAFNARGGRGGVIEIEG